MSTGLAPPQTTDQVTLLSGKSCDLSDIILDQDHISRDDHPGPRTNVVAPRRSFGAPRLAEPVVILHQTFTPSKNQSHFNIYHI